VINTASNTVVATVPIAGPSAISIIPPPQGVPFLSFNAKLDINLGREPNQAAFDGANIWVGTSTGVSKLRASDGANLGNFGIGNGADGVAFDGANVWVTSELGATVTKL
jgi:hypothetical protein